RALPAAVSQATPSFSILGSPSFREAIAASGQCGGTSRRALQTRGGARAHTYSHSRCLVAEGYSKRKDQTVLSLPPFRARAGALKAAATFGAMGFPECPASGRARRL